MFELTFADFIANKAGSDGSEWLQSVYGLPIVNEADNTDYICELLPSVVLLASAE